VVVAAVRDLLAFDGQQSLVIRKNYREFDQA
jgi:hypothetical protein